MAFCQGAITTGSAIPQALKQQLLGRSITENDAQIPNSLIGATQDHEQIKRTKILNATIAISSTMDIRYLKL